MNCRKLYSILMGAVMTIITGSCTDGTYKRPEGNIVITEVMASNRSGLLSDKGRPADWIEIKNLSPDSVTLEDCDLLLTKMVPDTLHEGKFEEETKSWTFPAVKIAGGSTMVIFADKEPKPEEDEETGIEWMEEEEYRPGDVLTADFKLPKNGATLQLLTPRGAVVSEVTYGAVEADQAVALQPDGSFQLTFMQSPGFENTAEGYKNALETIDAQRNSPLKIWELMTRESLPEDNWVELKNIGEEYIDLSEYSLTKKLGNDAWTLPARQLAPGQIITVRLAGKTLATGGFNAPFKAGKAETVILLHKGVFADAMSARTAPPGGSIGRKNGLKGFFIFETPTRNSDNI